MSRRRSVTLRCFTPEVVLATAVAELALLVVVAWRTRLHTAFARLTVVALFLLATFQAAEFALCGVGGPALWAKAGWLAITFLPPVGLHMTLLALAGAHVRLARPLAVTCYAAAAALATVIASPAFALPFACEPHYVTFEVRGLFGVTYGVYYLVAMLMGLGVAFREALRYRERATLAAWITVAYTSFMLPSFALQVADAFAQPAMPSVMCGFALACAVILVWKVLPAYERQYGHSPFRRPVIAVGAA